MSNWKNVERAHARLLGLVRVYVSRTTKGEPDSRGRGLAIESKSGIVGGYIPKRIIDWWQQAKRNAGTDKPVLIIHPKRGRFEEDLVVIEMSWFMEIMDVLHPEERKDQDN